MGKPRLRKSTKSRGSNVQAAQLVPSPGKETRPLRNPRSPNGPGPWHQPPPRGARNGRHVGYTWGRWRAALRDPTKSALPLRGPRHLPGPPIRSALQSPAPYPAALALLCPRPSWRAPPCRRHTRKEVAALAQPLTKASLPEVPPPTSSMLIGFSFRRSTDLLFHWLQVHQPFTAPPSSAERLQFVRVSSPSPSLSNMAVRERPARHAGSCRHPGRSGW